MTNRIETNRIRIRKFIESLTFFTQYFLRPIENEKLLSQINALQKNSKKRIFRAFEQLLKDKKLVISRECNTREGREIFACIPLSQTRKGQTRLTAGETREGYNIFSVARDIIFRGRKDRLLRSVLVCASSFNHGRAIQLRAF